MAPFSHPTPDIRENSAFPSLTALKPATRGTDASPDAGRRILLATDGPPGEVTSQQLSDAIAGTTNNPASVGPYTGDFSDPPTQQEMRDFRDLGQQFLQRDSEAVRQ